MKYSKLQTKYIGKKVGLRTYQHPCIDPIRPGFPGTTADLWVFTELWRGVPQNSVRDAKYPGFFEVIKCKKILTTSKNIMTSPRWENTSIAVVPKVCSADPTVSATISQGIHRYISVMGTLIFIFFNSRNNVLLKIISERL